MSLFNGSIFFLFFLASMHLEIFLTNSAIEYERIFSERFFSFCRLAVKLLIRIAKKRFSKTRLPIVTQITKNMKTN